MAMIDKVKSENFEMEYCKFGIGDKPFVIIPGISIKSVVALADAVEAQFGAFCKDYTIYLFDRKLDIFEDYSVRQMADDTADAMELLGIENAAIFGASQGGMIALCLGIYYPELVSKLVLASTLSKVSKELDASLDSWLSFAKNYDAGGLARCFVDSVYSKQTLDAYRDTLLAQFGDVTDEELDRFYHIAKGTKGYDVYDELEKISCPTLAVAGKEDKVLGVDGTLEIAKKLNCDCYIYDDFGHAVYDEAPDFHSRMIDFLNK